MRFSIGNGQALAMPGNATTELSPACIVGVDDVRRTVDYAYVTNTGPLRSVQVLVEIGLVLLVVTMLVNVVARVLVWRVADANAGH